MLQQPQQPVEQQFNPTYTEKQIRSIVSLYKKNPAAYASSLDSIRQHAQYYNVPFYEGDFSILEAVKQAGAGFIEGFTTLNISPDHPDNEYEAVARNLGHLVGFAPGILSGPLGWAGKIANSKTLLNSAKAVAGVKGLPLYLSDKYITPKARSIVGSIVKSNVGQRNRALGTAKSFLLGEQAKSVIEGGFNLGTASALSSWQHGVDNMMHSFFGGAVAGGVFRGIGNIIGKNVPAVKDSKGNLLKGKQYPISVQSEKGEKFARALSGSLFMGIPSTMRGDTNPEQIYEYLMGAYFGGSEKPWTTQKARKIWTEKVQPKFKDNPKLRQTKDPEATPDLEWKSLEPEVQNELKRIGIGAAGGTPEQITQAAYALYEGMGKKVSDIPSNKKVEDVIFKNYEDVKTNIVKKAITGAGSKKKAKALDPKKDPSLIHIITGGEEGIASEFTKEAHKRGISTVQLIAPGQKLSFGKQKSTMQVFPNTEVLSEANPIIDILSKTFNTNVANFQRTALDSIKRDYQKIKHSDAVFVIGSKISPNLKGPEGFQKYAVEMAKQLNKPIFISDTSIEGKKGANTWFKYNQNKGYFQTVNKTPKLPLRYAVLGEPLKTGFKVSKEDSNVIKELFTEYDKKGFKDDYIKKMEDKENSDKEASEMPDTGERVVTPMDNKMQYIFHRYLQKEIRDQVENNTEMNLKIMDFSKKASELANDILGLEESSKWNKLNLENKSEQWADAVEQEIGLKLGDHMRREMRKWATVQQQGVPVRIINYNGDTVSIADKNSPYSIAGLKKLMIEPIKDIEIIFAEDMQKIDKNFKMPEEGVYSILDTINKGGVDVELGRYVMNEVFNGTSLKEAISKKRSLIAKAIKKMKSQYGMHPFSGYGDKDRIMFVKYHPEFKKVKINLSEKEYKLDKSFLGELSFNEWKDMVKSNIAYDLSLNGKPIGDPKAVMSDGYIKNATGFNKRSQIWMTNGWRGDRNFIKKYGGSELKLNKNDNFKGSLIDDPEKVKNILKANNIEIEESFDGAIIATEESVDIINKDAGHPFSGQNKSFLILRDPNNGTMLGKYMIHKAHPEMSKMMKEYKDSDGVNFLIMKSAIKQRGDIGGEKGSYDLEGNQLNLRGDAKNIVEITPESFRYNHSVFQDPAMLGVNESGKYIGTTIPKQLLSLPHRDAFTKINQEVINDWYNELSQKSFDGKARSNELLYKYSQETDAKQKKKLFNDVLDNFENIGVEEVFRILREPGEEALAQEFLLKILRTNKHAIGTLSAASELSGNDLSNEIRGVVSFTGVADKLIKNMAASKESLYPLFYDKYTKNYIQKALDGYVADKVLNPKADNALMARMRPYDVYMQKLFPELNSDKKAQKTWGKNADELFYLGDLYRDTIIKTEIDNYKKTTLGELWDAYKNKLFDNDVSKKKMVEDVFEAISVRVPQDSMSGAQVLHFRGFTGVKDHGILQHGRVLRAEGGADLDGDESFVYFGGKAETGEGFGMKNSFKEMFRAQKDEYIIPKDKSKPVTPAERGKYLSTIEGAKETRRIDRAYRRFIKHTEKEHNESINSGELGTDLDGKKKDYQFGKGELHIKGEKLESSPEGIKVVWNPHLKKMPNQKWFTRDGALKEIQKKIKEHIQEVTDKNIKKSREGSELANVKEMFKDELLIGKKELKKMGIPPEIIDIMQGKDKTMPHAKFFPGVRLFTGEKAVEGRNLLAPIVSMTQNMRAAWSSVRKLANATEDLEVISYGDGTIIKKVLKAKEPSSRQRLLSSAMTAFGADPMDMTGLKNMKDLRTILTDSYFETGFKKITKKGFVDIKKSEFKNIQSIKASKKEKKEVYKDISSYDKIKGFNEALFGKNWNKDRSWTNAEKIEKLNEIETFETDSIDTALPKMALTLKNIDLNFSIFNRINSEAVKSLYESTNKEAAKLNWIKPLLGRTYLKTPFSKEIYFASKEKLHEAYVIEDFSKAYLSTDRVLRKSIEDGGYGIEPVYKDFRGNIVEKKDLTKEIMKDYLLYTLKEADRRLSDDLHDMVTLKLIEPEVRSKRITNNEVKDISKNVEAFKQTSILNQIQRRTQGAMFDDLTPAQRYAMKRTRELQLALLGETNIKDFSNEKRSKLLDMGQLDVFINKYKESLSPTGKKVFDYLLIGSLRDRNVHDKIESIFKLDKLTGDNKFNRMVKDALYEHGSKTSTTQLAYESENVSPSNIQRFLALKGKYFNKTMTEINEKSEAIKEFNKELEKVDPKENVFSINKNAVDMTGYEGLSDLKVEITSEQRKIVSELEHNLKQITDYSKMDLNQLVAGIYSDINPIVTKNLNQMNIEDFKRLNTWFEMNRKGTIRKQIERQIDEVNSAKVSGWDFMGMPEQVNKNMMARDLKMLKVKAFFQDKDGVAKEGYVLRPTYYGDTIRNMIGRLHEIEDGFSLTKQNQLNNKISFLDQVPDGEAIWNLAMRYHELQNKSESPIYEKQWKDSVEKHNWPALKVKKYIIGSGKEREEFTGHQLLKKAVKRWKEFANETYRLTRGEEGALDEYQEGWYDGHKPNPSKPKYDWKLFLRRLEKAYERGDNQHILSSLKVGIDGMRHINRSMMIDLLPATEYIKTHGWGKGTKISVDDYWKLSFKQKGYYKPGRSERAERYANLEIFSTDYRKGWFPHYFLSNKKHKESMDFELSELKKSKKSISQEEYQERQKKIFLKYRTRNGDWDIADYEMMDKMDTDLFGDTLLDLAKGKKLKENNSFLLENVNETFNSMNKREHHTGGYSVGVENAHLYIRNLSRTAFRQLANMTSRYTLHQMREHMTKKWVKGNDKERAEGQELVKGWLNFWSLYAKRAMGMPTIISDKMYNDKSLKLDASPYGWWADNRFANFINTSMKKMGLSAKIPKALKMKKGKIDFENMSKEDIESVESYLGKTAWDAQRWSNLEAKFELATLMTHPKTPINNIFGGTMHTFQSVGYEPLRKARNLKELQRINPEWTSWDKVMEFVESHGVVPEATLHQFGLDKDFRGSRAKAFVTDLANKSTGLKEISKIDMVALANKYGVSKAIMNKAALFMSVPERILRRDAFMAHYIKAWERLGGSIKNIDNPILIELAKKGVKATQFLYNSAERPAFAATALGKMFSRFQLWSWNAVRFRNDVRKQAQLYGFKPGTEAMRKFERTMQADMFIMALGSVFMYSLFGQTVPAPYNWLQDTAEWIFGDETERDRAFFGTYPSSIAPLQMITPPLARFPISVIREFAEDDYTKLADYYVWTMFPFGRMLRDVGHPETSIIANPMRIPEKVFGVPLTGFSKESKRMREGDSYTSPSPGTNLGKIL